MTKSATSVLRVLFPLALLLNTAATVSALFDLMGLWALSILIMIPLMEILLYLIIVLAVGFAFLGANQTWGWPVWASVLVALPMLIFLFPSRAKLVLWWMDDKKKNLSFLNSTPLLEPGKEDASEGTVEKPDLELFETSALVEPLDAPLLDAMSVAARFNAPPIVARGESPAYEAAYLVNASGENTDVEVVFTHPRAESILFHEDPSHEDLSMSHAAGEVELIIQHLPPASSPPAGRGLYQVLKFLIITTIAGMALAFAALIALNGWGALHQKAAGPSPAALLYKHAEDNFAQQNYPQTLIYLKKVQSQFPSSPESQAAAQSVETVKQLEKEERAPQEKMSPSTKVLSSSAPVLYRDASLWIKETSAAEKVKALQKAFKSIDDGEPRP